MDFSPILLEELSLFVNFSNFFWILPSLTKKQIKTLEGFLKTLSPDHNYVIEFRHRRWFCKEMHELLSEHNAIFCILSALGVPSDAVVTGKLAYTRFHGDYSWYDSNYGAEELKDCADKIKKLKVDTLAYFNNGWRAYVSYNTLELDNILRNSPHSKR